MRIVLFYHSLISDLNDGSAQYLREIVEEFLSRGHVVQVYEPKGGRSSADLCWRQGDGLVRRLEAEYPCLRSSFYDLDMLDIGAALDGADLVIVHERSDPALVRKIGKHRKVIGRYMLVLHDTRHCSATGSEIITSHDLLSYDGVLASDEGVVGSYLTRGWATRAWIWPETLDAREHGVDELLKIHSDYADERQRRSEGVADEIDPSRIILLPGVRRIQ